MPGSLDTDSPRVLLFSWSDEKMFELREPGSLLLRLLPDVQFPQTSPILCKRLRERESRSSIPRRSGCREAGYKATLLTPPSPTSRIKPTGTPLSPPYAAGSGHKGSVQVFQPTRFASRHQPGSLNSAEQVFALEDFCAERNL